jgi:hypothetical protein
VTLNRYDNFHYFWVATLAHPFGRFSQDIGLIDRVLPLNFGRVVFSMQCNGVSEALHMWLT